LTSLVNRHGSFFGIDLPHGFNPRREILLPLPVHLGLGIRRAEHLDS
jgi:hypothetical protein